MTELHILFTALAFFAGLNLGAWLANLRWSNNARDFRRLEHKGRLYKVHFADHFGEPGI